jgi:hypothetical protein
MVARMDTLLRKETVKAFALGVGLLALFVGAATPLCI